MMPIKALGNSQAELTFALDVSVSMGQALAETTERESAPKIFIPALEGGKNLIYPMQQQFLAIYTVFLQVKPPRRE